MPWRPLNQSEPDLPRSISRSLAAVAADMGMSGTDHLATVFGGWEDVVGAAIAAHAQPISLSDGVLSVSVDHPSWVTQLRMLSPKILSALEERAGTTVATEIVFKVSRS